MKVLLILAMLFTLFIGSQARAGEWDKDTRVTFGGAIQIPGAVLDAGSYRFKLADNISNRHIVQIFTGDGARLIQTVFAIPNWQLKSSGETVLLYAERRSGEPPALEAWFYPGESFGQQFVYPRSQAAKLSHLNNTTVPSSEADNVLPSNPESAQPPAETAPIPAASDSSAENQAPLAQTETTESAEVTPEPQAQTQNTQNTLPQTASEVPLIGLAGFLFLGAAALLGLLARQKV